MLSSLKEELMSPNRIVAFLTPLVFAPLAGVISTWAAENLPGVNLPASAMEEIFIAGALIALAPAAQWLHGWQKWEQQREANVAIAGTTITGPSVAAEAPPEPEDFEDFEDLDELDDFDEFEDISMDEDEPVPVGS
jgi:hypothetical protein